MDERMKYVYFFFFHAGSELGGLNREILNRGLRTGHWGPLKQTAFSQAGPN